MAGPARLDPLRAPRTGLSRGPPFRTLPHSVEPVGVASGETHEHTLRRAADNPFHAPPRTRLQKPSCAGYQDVFHGGGDRIPGFCAVQWPDIADTVPPPALDHPSTGASVVRQWHGETRAGPHVLHFNRCRGRSVPSSLSLPPSGRASGRSTQRFPQACAG